jgi:transcriptional antiterminator RfaH
VAASVDVAAGRRAQQKGGSRAMEYDDVKRWYVIHTHPRQEARAESNLRAWGVETFKPTLKQRRRQPYTNKPFYVVKPMFPRYIFARFGAAKILHKVSFTRGVHSVVSFGDGPTTIEDEVIDFIKSQAGQDGHVTLTDRLSVGDEVTITAGPLKGLMGVFDKKLKEDDRIIVLLKTVSYQLRVVVQGDVIEKVRAQAG